METENEALKLECRKRIYECIIQNPGTHFRELQRLLSLSLGSLEYHLRYLEESECISSKSDARFTRYYPRNKFDPESKAALAFLRQPLPRGIMLFLLDKPHSNHKQILANFSVNAATLSYHLKRMSDQGVVKADHVGRETFFEVMEPEKIKTLIIVYRRSFLDGVLESFATGWLAGRQ